MRQFHEFFAGGGMARLGLGSGWKCCFANDFDEGKCRSYADNRGDAVVDAPGRASERAAQGTPS